MKPVGYLETLASELEVLLPGTARKRLPRWSRLQLARLLDMLAPNRTCFKAMAQGMKMNFLLLVLLLHGTGFSAERHVSFDDPGSEASGWRWLPVTLTDDESALLATRSDSPRTALDFYLLLSGSYFRNIRHETERRIAFIERETLSDRYLHAEYTIPSVDAGAFWVTIRLFGNEDNPLIAIGYRGGTKRLFAAKENGPQGLWTITLNRPQFWNYRGDSFSEGGALVRVPDSVLPEPSVERILDRYHNHYKAHLNYPTQKKSIYLYYDIPREGHRVQVTGRENFMKSGDRYVWADYTYNGEEFEPSPGGKEDGKGQAAPADDSK